MRVYTFIKYQRCFVCRIKPPFAYLPFSLVVSHFLNLFSTHTLSDGCATEHDSTAKSERKRKKKKGFRGHKKTYLARCPLLFVRLAMMKRRRRKRSKEKVDWTEMRRRMVARMSKQQQQRAAVVAFEVQERKEKEVLLLKVR